MRQRKNNNKGSRLTTAQAPASAPAEAAAAAPLSSNNSKRISSTTVFALIIYAGLVILGATLIGNNTSDIQSAVTEEIDVNRQQSQTETANRFKSLLQRTGRFVHNQRRRTHPKSGTDKPPKHRDRRRKKPILSSADPPNNRNSLETIMVAAASYPTAFSLPVSLTAADIEILQEFSQRVLTSSTDKDSSIKPTTDTFALVPWGGGSYESSSSASALVEWFDSARTTTSSNNNDPLDAIAGGHLLQCYYRIMKTNMKDPKDLSQKVHFPFGLASKQGIAAERAILHTLEWRLAYRPFQVTPACITENSDGFIYHRGLSRSADSAEAGSGAHAMIWNRTGRHKAKDPLAYFRCILNAADRAVATALMASQGRVGKFNVVIDAAGYSWGNLPAISYIKQAVTMLQDHYPDRLGAVFLVNLSRTAEFVINVIKPLLTKEVREKLYILPHDPKKLLEALESVVDKKDIPEWLGGEDSYQFDVQAYYPSSMHMTEAQGKEFITAMPYHA